MIKKANFHTHTTFCDGCDTMENMVRAAIAKGFTALGFSGHSYGQYDEDYCMSRTGTQLYKTEFARLKEKYEGRIRLYCGIEQDYFAQDEPVGFDYVIGSVHYVPKDGVYVSVDASRENLESCVRRHWNGDHLAFAEDYYALMGTMADRLHPDFIAHFDLVTKFNEGPDGYTLFDEQSPRYLAAAQRALEQLIQADIPFEINTGAIARGYRKTPYPSAEMMRRIRDMGGRFIYSSDCHRKEKLDCGFGDVTAMAQEMGLCLTDFRLA